MLQTKYIKMADELIHSVDICYCAIFSPSMGSLGSTMFVATFGLHLFCILYIYKHNEVLTLFPGHTSYGKIH